VNSLASRLGVFVRRVTAVTLLSLANLPQVAFGAGDNTILKITQTGRISLGVSEHDKPTLYRDANGELMGYHMEICKRVVDAIKQRFDLPGLKVVTVATNLATRFSLLNNETTDIDCGHNPVNGSGLRQALFTHAALLTETRIMTISENKDLTLAALDGKTIGTIVGNTSLPLLRARLRQSKMKVTEVFGRNTTEVFSLLESGRVDAIMLSMPYLLSAKEASTTPSRYILLDGALNVEPIAMTVRLDDEKLMSVINEVLDGMMRSGEMARLYKRWFVDPIPGTRNGLNLPLPDALQELFKAPGSEMLNL
jgi:glutamate/aspartate transport system substrate-binding protein